MATARVASVHFAPAKLIDRSNYGGMYAMPAYEKGKEPYILTVDDKVQHDDGPVTSGPGGGRREKLHYLVAGQDIANDIVREWAHSGVGMTPGARPGIWVIRERLPVMKQNPVTGSDDYVMDGFGNQVFRPATEEEKAAMFEEDLIANQIADREYAVWCYTEGNRIAADARLIQFIPKTYKLAAVFYGFDAAWVKSTAATDIFGCPHCTKMIPRAAMICGFCQQPVDLQRWAAFMAQKDAAVADFKGSTTPGKPISAPIGKAGVPKPSPAELLAQQGTPATQASV